MLKIFGTDGIRCKVNEEPMTTDTCLRIAKAAGYLLSNKEKKKSRVIISKDTRLSGYIFEPIMTSGFISMGMDVILSGPLPTPALSVIIDSLRAIFKSFSLTKLPLAVLIITAFFFIFFNSDKLIIELPSFDCLQ